MTSAQLPMQPEAPTALADIHDRVMEAYYGKLGEHFMRETQTRIHWICAQVSGKSVLDVGCSQGIVPLLLAREGCDVIGVDTSPQAIEEAKSYMAAEPAHVQAKVSYVNADFLSLNVQDAEPDTIVISEVLEHLVRPEMFIEKAAALLKPDGRLIITVPFGVNDFIDHKHTFYLLEPFRLLNEHLHITQIKVLGKWLGMVAIKKSEATAPADAQLSMEQIQNLEKAFEAIERNLQNSLTSTNKSLAEANKKYRAATEQIALLKPQAQKAEELTKKTLAQEAALAEQADIKLRLEEANKKYRTASEQVQQLKSQLAELESTTSPRLEQNDKELSELRSRLEAAQEQLKQTQAQHDSLKAQLQALQAESQLQLEQKDKELGELRPRFEQTRELLQDTQAKHDLLQAQLETLQAESLLELEHKDKELGELRPRFDENRELLQDTQAQYDLLKAQLTALQAESQLELEQKDNELGDLRPRFDEIQQQLQDTQARHDLLKAQLQALQAEHQLELEQKEQQLAQLQALTQESQTLAAQNVRLQEQLTEEQAGRHQAETARISISHDAEQQLHAHEAIQARLEEDIDTLLLQVDDLNNLHEREMQELNNELKECRARITELAGLLEHERSIRPLLESELATCEAHVAQMDRELQVKTDQHLVVSNQFESERSARQQLELTINELEHQAQEALLQGEKLAMRLQQQTNALEDLRQQNADLQELAQRELRSRETAEQQLATAQEQAQLELANREAAEQLLATAQEQAQLELANREAAEQLLATAQDQWRQQQADLLEQIQLERSSREATDQLLATTQEQWSDARQRMESELTSSKGWIEAANQKYREVTGKQIPHLKTNLEKLLEQTTAQQQKIEELNDNLHRANAKRHLAEQRLIKTRSSLTYQLGYQLKASASSLGGIIRLPGTLFNLYRQASKSRKDTTQKAIGFDRPTALLPAPQHITNTAALPAALGDTEYVRNRLLNHEQNNAASLKVACVMDEFTYGSYRHECNLLQLTPEGWHAQLQQFQPELVFIESAWRGKDDLWGSKVGHNSQELQDILKWCKDHKVPSVFWNKEDPVHFETFLSTAKQFDFVFTTDIDCIHRYKGALGHERVYLLPFACQPAVHNPVELYERKDAFCFAGAYYARYPERTRDLGNFVSELPRFRPLEIFDRNFGKNDANYQFPEQYQPYIVGTLSFEQIDRAYKGYRYAINLNSIKQSQSMFARRVFELLGSNTVTVSNFSRGVRLLFGDLVITTDSGPEMLRRLNTLAGNERDSDKLRLAALRKVMQEHTYAHRLGYVMSKVTGKAQQDDLPHVCILADAANSAEVEALTQHLQRQRYTNLSMHVVVNDTVGKTAVKDPRVKLISRKQLRKISLGELAGDAPLFAAMVSEDYYGPNYMLDMVLATRYNQAQVIGKVTHYVRDAQGVHLQNPGQAYRRPRSIAARAALIKTSLIAQQPAAEWLKKLATLHYEYEQSLAIDAFNYCKNAAGANAQEVTSMVDDLDLYTGITIDELQSRAEAIKPLEVSHTCAEISGRDLAAMFGPIRSKQVEEYIDADTWQITSSLADGKHEYHYAKHELAVDELMKDEQLKLFLDATPGLNIQLVVLFLDAQKQRISHVMQYANRNQTSDVPPEAAYIRLGIRAYSNGSAGIKALVLGHRDLQPSEMLAKSDYLLLTNHYPSYDDLYRNGFVHTRVTAYQEQGVNVDVFRLRKNEPVSYHEFENVDVMTGSQATLAKMLESGAYKTILVHFLDPDMWEVLRRHLNTTKVIVWVHGAEIQPWWRREYNFTTEAQLALGKLDSDKRMSFWRNLLQPMPTNLKLVFVSRYFAEEVMEDLGFRLPESQYEIIHNPINTELFSYVEKPVEQRKKILSIRPYASRTYANDLSVKAIQLLAQKPWFNELEFRMIGDGPLFEETLAPLRQYSNVQIQKGYLKQKEIAELHKEYGVFLCPSRMDTQGVSRDEAMASGLVPITNSVAAIPEFLDQDCGFLSDSESFTGLSDGIEAMVLNAKLFTEMSLNARKRVTMQSNKTHVSKSELKIIGDTTSK
ncbi:methyltransferase domain-containing protein [Pseudomonas sp. 15FMM2]|uniref:Methyltransferase domain-containing protein n=1 Tax=Pseudomonas imrae TaxID=2992837 RepID=A0ACC7PJJ9_9PSED